MIFSVIVPFLNEARYIKHCIDSLLNEDFDKNEYELIFVDNNSTDNSRKIVEQIPEIILLQENRKNVYAARNKGLSVAKGEIIAFTDADCVVSKDWLTQIYNGMRNNDATIVLGKRCFPSKRSYLLRVFEDYENAKVEYILRNCSREHFFGFTNNMAVKADAFKHLGFFSELEVTGDTEFIQRCVSTYEDAKIVYLKEMRVTHLEVTNAKVWVKKINIYGEHNAQVEKIRSGYKGVNCKVRLRIYMYCVKKNRYTLGRAIIFIFLALVGDLSYLVGKIKGYFKFRNYQAE